MVISNSFLSQLILQSTYFMLYFTISNMLSSAFIFSKGAHHTETIETMVFIKLLNCGNNNFFV